MSEEITQQEENENQPAGGSQTFTQEQVNQLVGAARFDYQSDCHCPKTG
ncbi:hypothetical protein [Adlercreutzia agrestimuris]|nr:hypothetical protein [Adlercreutzia agrestimuris]